ncbi:MAG: hypothetical protein KJ880_03045, partial [Candidatus Omnitrophica bacterium]|nr:hypothetical protein [Candidatus Omnitrophota bacterium]
AEAKKAIKDTYEAGISVCTNWIVGFPTETEEDFQETINFIRENIRYLKSNMMVNSFILKGESLLFQQQEEFGITFDSDGHWKSLDGINTIEERRRRYARLLDLLSENNDIAAHKTFQG